MNKLKINKQKWQIKKKLNKKKTITKTKKTTKSLSIYRKIKELNKK